MLYLDFSRRQGDFDGCLDVALAMRHGREHRELRRLNGAPRIGDDGDAAGADDEREDGGVEAHANRLSCPTRDFHAGRDDKHAGVALELGSQSG